VLSQYKKENVDKYLHLQVQNNGMSLRYRTSSRFTKLRIIARLAGEGIIRFPWNRQTGEHV